MDQVTPWRRLKSGCCPQHNVKLVVRTQEEGLGDIEVCPRKTCEYAGFASDRKPSDSITSRLIKTAKGWKYRDDIACVF